jgi:MMP 1-O-methyltransferase
MSVDAPTSDRLGALMALARSTRGFMPDDEGAALFRAALRAGRTFGSGRARTKEAGDARPKDTSANENGEATPAPPVLLEIGAWCGKSTVYLGAAAELAGGILYSVDHHRGSEENQPGWQHHDPDLVDPSDGRLDTLPQWRRTVAQGVLEEWVVGVVGDSPTVAATWQTPLAFCFIDGGHGEAPAWSDYRGWTPHVALGGWLAIHDVFPNPADGGRPPYELWCDALQSGQWAADGECGSLRVLRRVTAAGAVCP